MSDTLKIILIPLDNRPVSYSLPVQIGKLNKNVEILIPPKNLVGGLTDYTNIDKVLLWINNTLAGNDIDFIVCSLDTVAYGGLIPSRKSCDTKSMIRARLSDFRIIVENIKHKHKHNTKLYGFSSIMRISNNNINEEEKEYWDKYGELIFRFSYLKHKSQSVFAYDVDREELENIKNKIPENILNDYLNTRKRNFDINKTYLSWIEEGFLDFLVYSQDDTAEWGYNVQEALALQEMIDDKNLSEKIMVRTGADEISCDLSIRGILDKYNETIYILPVFSTESGKNIISRYEDKTILESTLGQINLCGAEFVDNLEFADIILLVHTPVYAQNDYAMGIYTEPENEEAIKFCANIIKDSDKPVILADIASANGADNALVNNLLAKGVNLKTLYGYAGWNTTGNTLGSAISTGISRYIAEELNSFDTENFKKLFLIRLADDWAYQSVIRQKIRALTDEADIRLLEEELKPFIINLAQKLNLDLPKIELSFPWNRTFEVKINLSCN